MTEKRCCYCGKKFLITEKEKTYCSMRCRKKKMTLNYNYGIEHKEALKIKTKIYRDSHREQLHIGQKLYRENNGNKIKIRGAKYYIKNKERHNRQTQSWYKKNSEYHKKLRDRYNENNRDKIAIQTKEYRVKNRLLLQQRHKYKYENDLNYRIHRLLANRVLKMLKGISKSASTMELAGCPPELFVSYIESLFLPGMNWDNQGSEWDIDHIRPCTSFYPFTPENQQLCFHFLNQQPLWHKDNVIKGDRYNDDDKKRWEKTEKEIIRFRGMNLSSRNNAILKLIENKITVIK